MSRPIFFQFQNTDFPGEFIYVRSSNIIGVQKTLETDSSYYEVFTRGAESWSLTDEDGAKLMRWAQANSERLPDHDAPDPGSWR